jgi:hypothetical protein
LLNEPAILTANRVHAPRHRQKYGWADHNLEQNHIYGVVSRTSASYNRAYLSCCGVKEGMMYRSLTVAAALSVALVSVASPAAAAPATARTGGLAFLINGALNFHRPPLPPIPPSAAFGLRIARNACSSIGIPFVTRICLSAIPEPPASLG